jgi:methylmalonyl-CoA mutase
MNADSLRFSTPDEMDWRSLATKALGGAEWEKLRVKSRDGFAIEPLYRESDFAAAAEPWGAPGAAPFVRGDAAKAPPDYPWDLRSVCLTTDPRTANAEILEDLEGGASSVLLAPAEDQSEFETRLKGVFVDLAPIALEDASASSAQALADHLRAHSGAERPHAFNLAPQDAPVAVALGAAFPTASLLCADARPAHEAGASPAQDVAAAVSVGIACLRALQAAGLPPDLAAPRILFRVGVETDILLECAKLRALRLCWARVCEASGVAPERRLAKIEASTSARMLTRRDAWTNVLRITASVFASAIGGANAIVASSFTDAIGAPNAFARRLARNTQHVLMREAGLGRVADPAGGAWSVEAITEQLAHAGWALMQRIEAAGGWRDEAARALLAAEIARARDARLEAIARRAEPITGVTDFPLLGALAPEVAGPPLKRTLDSLFPPVRWSAAFEDLADAGEAAAAVSFVAVLGPLAEAGPRAQFAANLLASGGIAPRGAETASASLDALIGAFRAGGARVAVLAGADARYEAAGLDAVRALKAAGCDWLAIAGQPANLAALEAAGVDQTLFAGMDVTAALRTLHAAAGVRRGEAA